MFRLLPRNDTTMKQSDAEQLDRRGRAEGPRFALASPTRLIQHVSGKVTEYEEMLTFASGSHARRRFV